MEASFKKFMVLFDPLFDSLIKFVIPLVIFLVFHSLYHYYNNLIKVNTTAGDTKNDIIQMKEQNNPPLLTCSSIKFRSFLEESMPVLAEKYRPTFWCYGSRIQTTLAYLLCPDFHVPYEREILKLDDGGEVALDWLRTKNEDAPIILILPGLTGHSGIGYVKKFVINAYECNFQSVVFNYRGLNGTELKTPKLYSINDVTDLARVVQHIKERYPDVILGACGVSLGGLMLAHYLVEYSHQQKISVAMLNSAPFDILVAANNVESGINIIYNKYLTWQILNAVARFKHVLDVEDRKWDITQILKSKTIREYDDLLTSKMFGYNTVHEYYKEASLLDKMDKIKIPVLCLSSADDIIQPLEYSEDRSKPLFDNENVAFVMTAAGGHISHIEGLWPFWKKTSFMYRVFTQYFTAMLENNSYKEFLNTELNE